MTRILRSLMVAMVALLAASAPAAAQLFGSGGRCCGGGLLGGLLGGLGGGFGGGCPIVESRPGIVEGMVAVQQAEILLQKAHMLTQIENMIAMRLVSPLDTAGAVAGRLAEARQVLGRVEGVLWDLGAVDADFQTLYPPSLPEDWDSTALAAHQDGQARLARAASRASKLASADAVTAVAGYPARVEQLMASLKACTGQTCATDTAAQSTLLAAEVSPQLLLVQAAHHRAMEARLDYEQAAIERARVHSLIAWRGIDRYGDPG